MFDIINGKTINEEPKLILNRYQSEMELKNRENSIIEMCRLTYSLVKSWVCFSPYTPYHNPYEYLGHTIDIPEGTARVYFQIGSILNRFDSELKSVDLEKIASSYMLKELPKASDNHQDFNDVIHALMTLSVRKFAEYANTRDLPQKSTGKSSGGKKGNSFSPISIYRPQLREAFDANREVFVIGVTSQEQWEAIKEALRRNTIHIVSSDSEEDLDVITVLSDEKAI